ncbi:MAG: type II toxin-antitoxin system VapC family toxin [Bacillota bacterium]|nr:type II toxin-antitoxin system VapC family toxin [Bacillota bacterium]
MSKKKIVLDTFAVLAVVEDEPGAQTVADVILNEEVELHMSAISLGEAYYTLLRRRGREPAEETVNSILADESFIIDEASWQRIKGAAAIKAQGGLSYADAFVLGLAQEMQAAVVTGDPEIRSAAQEPGVEIIWIG